MAERMMVHHGDCLDVLRTLPDASVDSVVTDPPYELGFMGRAWDASGIAYSVDLWREVWRVLKPGGHLLAFGGTRTVHRLTCAIEDAGFDIRDGIDWLYGSGFPKSPGLLKPAREPIVMARKRGKGALNIDGCRVECGGRWPANVVLSHAPDCGEVCLDGCPVAELDQQSGPSRSHGQSWTGSGGTVYGNGRGFTADMPKTMESAPVADSGGASRYFPVFRYQAKAPTRERPKVDGVTHPTVKPLALMRWLVCLVTPEGGTVLDPFAGSGTTLEACALEGFRCVSIERDATYLPLIRARLDRVA